MDEQKRQSIQFDIDQLEIQLKEIEYEIQYKEDELKFVSSKVRPAGIVGGAASGLLGFLSLSPAGRSISAIKNIAPVVGIKGADTGNSISETFLKNLQVEIALLKRDREHIIKQIKDRKDKLK